MQRYKLSPAYDITRTENKFEHEMIVNGKGNPTDDNILTLAKDFGLSLSKCKAILENIKVKALALAGRTGELLNMESLAKDIGVSAPTIKRWISILQASNVIYLLQPFSLNTTKRVVKTPKVYFTDTGLVCYLCRWLTTETLMNGAQAGNIFETFVLSEIIKSYYNAGKEPNLYFFRNGDGQEIDLMFYENGKVYPVEIKKTASPNVKDIKSFKVLVNYFPTIEMGEGGVICTAESLLPLGQGNKIIPINYI